MAINGPKEAPNTITTVKPSLTKFKGEKSQIFTPKILSCFSTRRKEKKTDYSSFTAHLWTDWKGMLQCFLRHRKDPKMIERLKNDFTIGMKAYNTDFSN